MIMLERTIVPDTSIAMLDKDHHIHLVPSGRVLMMSIEHSAMKKVEKDRYEIECYLKLSVEGFPHPLEDAVRFTFAAAGIPDPQMMAELIFIQNHIIKIVFDKGLAGTLSTAAPDDILAINSGISLSSEIKAQMSNSAPLMDVLARNGALPDSLTFIR
jgi:hypothetical protein